MTLRKLRLMALAGTLALSLMSCQTGSEDNNPDPTRGKELPLLKVNSHGISQSQVDRLLQSFGVEIKDVRVSEDGSFAFADEALHGVVPSFESEWKGATSGEGDDEEGEFQALAFDLDALKAFRAPSTDEVAELAQKGFGGAGLTPERFGNIRANVRTSHTTLELVDAEGKPILDTINTDTRVVYDLSVDGIALHGPGAKVNASFVLADGAIRLSQLRHAMHSVSQGEMVQVPSQAEMQKVCEARLGLAEKSIGSAALGSLSVKAEVVYYAPPLAQQAALIAPHILCEGSLGEGEEAIHMLSEFVAISDPEAAPQLALDATVESSRVTAKVSIEGGQRPYSIQWMSASSLIEKQDSSEVSYALQGRDGVAEEVLTVAVTDANGVVAKATEVLTVAGGRQAAAFISPTVFTPQAGGVEFGIEIPAMEFGNVDLSFANEMNSDGVIQRYFWTGNNAWERDFKSPNDSSYADESDITLYTGHGYGGGFTFNGNNDDTVLDSNDATDDWGDLDEEWFILYSCQVLKATWSGQSRIQRWSQEFDGLHILMGFHTNAYANMDFSGEIADNMLDNAFLWWENPMKVRLAFFEAVDSDQPNGVTAVAMGPIGTGNVSNFSDYFWGRGSVGPDIRDNDIIGWWVQSYTN